MAEGIDCDVDGMALSVQTLNEQKEIQESIKLEERKQRRQRQDIFDVEDEIFLKRDDMMGFDGYGQLLRISYGLAYKSWGLI